METLKPGTPEGPAGPDPITTACISWDSYRKIHHKAAESSKINSRYSKNMLSVVHVCTHTQANVTFKHLHNKEPAWCPVSSSASHAACSASEVCEMHRLIAIHSMQIRVRSQKKMKDGMESCWEAVIAGCKGCGCEDVPPQHKCRLKCAGKGWVTDCWLAVRWLAVCNTSLWCHVL